MLWRSTLSGLALAHIETLDSFAAAASREVVRAEVVAYVIGAVEDLPPYYRVPVAGFAAWIGLLCLVTRGRSLADLAPATRQRQVALLRRLPFFALLEKLVRSSALIRYFDLLPGPAGASGARPR